PPLRGQCRHITCTPFPYTTPFRSPCGGRWGRARRCARPRVVPRGRGLLPSRPCRLPRPRRSHASPALCPAHAEREIVGVVAGDTDRKSTRLNSSHVKISYAVFCLK